MTRPTQAVRSHAGRVIGEVSGEVLRLRRRGSRHLLRQHDAWAVDEAALVRAVELGVERVCVEDLDSGQVYVVDIDDFFRLGLRVDFGHGAQLALPRSYWARSAASQLRLAIGT